MLVPQLYTVAPSSDPYVIAVDCRIKAWNQSVYWGTHDLTLPKVSNVEDPDGGSSTGMEER